jgi:hypothetical protein
LASGLIVDYFIIGLASILEVGFGIIATSLASCRPLIRKVVATIPRLRPIWSQHRTDELPAGWNRTEGVTRQPTWTTNTEKLPPTIGTIRSHTDLEDDIKVWESTCNNVRLTTAVRTLSKDRDCQSFPRSTASYHVSEELYLDV